jgi:predicted amidophosphoribosyltransferase
LYCSSCGVAVAQGLTYCKNCGAKLNPAETGNKSSKISPGGLVTSMVATFVMGTFVITMLMGVMKVIVQFDLGLIMAFTGLSFLIMLALEGIFITLLFRRTRGRHEPRETQPNDRATTRELEAKSRQPIEPIPSVTEHTTRAFDPVYSERK